MDLDAAVNAELAVRDEVNRIRFRIMSLISVKQVSVTHFCCSSVRLFHVSRFIMWVYCRDLRAAAELGYVLR